MTSPNIPSTTSNTSVTIRVPASTANLGPGFDVLGAALSLYLTLTVTFPPHSPSPNNQTTTTEFLECHITYESTSPSTQNPTPTSKPVPTNPVLNLITRVALYVSLLYKTRLPTPFSLAVHNQIPLSRGLGSSGSAIVAGVLLANELCRLQLSDQVMRNLVVLMEGHPDNVIASLLGGFGGSYIPDPVLLENWHRHFCGFEKAVVEGIRGNQNTMLNDPHCQRIPYDIILNSLPTDFFTPTFTKPDPETNLYIPVEPLCITAKYNWHESIRPIAIIPDFELPTSTSRSVLPNEFSKKDVVYNLQRIAVLTQLLGSDYSDWSVSKAAGLFGALMDKLHQPYRGPLIPHLEYLLDNASPASVKGLLGVCLSGAGPTVLVLATREDAQRIGQWAVDVFAGKFEDGSTVVNARYEVLDVDKVGAQVKLS